jgi:hypothetical protein
MSTKQDRSLEHIWHVWINRRQEMRRAETPDATQEHSLYEFKSMLQFLEYGHRLIQDAFEGKLATTHKQCSHSPTLPILNNVLKCAIGTEVTTCPILLQLRETFQSQIESITPFNGEKPYGDLPPKSVYGLMAKTCAWHIYATSCRVQEGWGGIDTSEGYLMDESDRMFWARVYESMAYDPSDDETGEIAEREGKS